MRFMDTTHTTVKAELKELGPLTKIEAKINCFAAQGNTQAETAEELHRSIETIKTHSKSILKKLGAKSIQHAVAISVARGLVDVKVQKHFFLIALLLLGSLSFSHFDKEQFTRIAGNRVARTRTGRRYG